MEIKPATLYQLIALRDTLLQWHDKNAAAACDNLIDILSNDHRLWNEEDGTYPSPIISGGDVYEPPYGQSFRDREF